MSKFARLHALLARSNQRFICHDLGWPERGPVRFTASITHEVTPPVGTDILDQIRAQVPEVPQLLELYSVFGSIRLYCDTIGDASGFYIAHPDEWSQLRAEYQPWLDMVEDEDPEDFPPPDWNDDFIVFGEIPNSGNYLLIPLAGQQAGCVIEFEHDGHEYIERGKDIASFIDYISTITPSLIQEIGSHARYSDGKTQTQWFPERYEHG